MAVFSLASLIKAKLNFPFIRAINRAPMAPIADASVGVAIPAMIDPRTRTIKSKGMASVFKTSMLDADWALGSN